MLCTLRMRNWHFLYCFLLGRKRKNLSSLRWDLLLLCKCLHASRRLHLFIILHLFDFQLFRLLWNCRMPHRLILHDILFIFFQTFLLNLLLRVKLKQTKYSFSLFWKSLLITQERPSSKLSTFWGCIMNLLDNAFFNHIWVFRNEKFREHFNND